MTIAQPEKMGPRQLYGCLGNPEAEQETMELLEE